MTDAAQVIARETLALEPQAQNVRVARRTVVATLLAAGRADLADTAELVTSEIVTNAVLHAAGALIQLSITVTEDGVLIEVEDSSSQLPMVREYDATATTGRGMTMVDRLVSAFGVRRMSDQGKVVWFTLGDPAQPAGAAPSGAAGVAAISLLGVPVALFCTFQETADGLLREYLLASGASDSYGAARREWARASSAFAELADGGAPAFVERDGGVSHLDLTLSVGRAAADRFTTLRRILDRAVSMATDGRLLAPPSQPEIVGLRNWCCEQVIGQVGGTAPEPWRSGRDAAVPTAAPIEWDPAGVTTSPLAVVAADDANRLIAVSAPAAELLGWRATELVGQRIVSIVPESLREAHIAGFVRHLVTGEQRILGSPVQVRALRRDGTEVAVVIEIEAQLTPGARTVFTATLTPVE